MINFKQINRKYYYIVVTVIFIITLLVGYHHFTKDIRIMTLTNEQQQPVNQLLSHSPTRCIGSYLIDLPVEFKAGKAMNFYYQDNQITMNTKPQYLPPFKQMIALREQELKQTKPVNVTDGEYLKAIYPLMNHDPDNQQGIIFERIEDTSSPDVFRILEGYRWQDNVTLSINVKANNGLASKYDLKRERSPDLYSNNVPQKLRELRQLFDRIQIRDDLTIPDQPGFCLLRGFLQGQDKELKDMNYGYWHNTIEDFSIYFDLNDYAGDYALLDKPEQYFTVNLGQTIYKGSRNSHGLKLEEWVVKGHYFAGDKSDNSNDLGYIFTLGIHMTDPTYKTPRLRIEMFYKIPLDRRNAFSEEQLMVIWREITSTIRLREETTE